MIPREDGGARSLLKVAHPRRGSTTWMTPQEAADYLCVGVKLIYTACATKGLKHSKMGHKTLRIKREWLDEWAEQRAAS